MFLRKSHVMILSAIIAISATVLFPSHSTAAGVLAVSNDKCQILVSGDIEQGDYDNIVTLAKNTRARTICLNSGGGSWIEGVKIAEFVMDRFIGTYVDRGNECYSVCAIIFLAGARKSRRVQQFTVAAGIFDKGFYRLPNRTMHVQAKVGFHAPYLTLRQKQYSASDIETARLAALQAFAKFLGMMARKKSVENDARYLAKRFISRALRKNPDELLMIDSIDMAGRLHVDLVGYKRPTRITERDLFWAATKALVWREDKSFQEFIDKNKKGGYTRGTIYECPSSFEHDWPFKRAFFSCWICGEGDWDTFIEVYESKSSSSALYIGIYSFFDERNKWKLSGISKALLVKGQGHLLSPIWYIYPHDTPLNELSDTVPTRLQVRPADDTCKHKGEYFIIAGSYLRKGSYPDPWIGKARQRAELLLNAGFEAYVIDTNQYPNLTNWLWAVVIGPYDKPFAKREMRKIRRFVPDAYVKRGR